MSYTTFKDNFSSGVNFLKRRFSSDDLGGEQLTETAKQQPDSEELTDQPIYSNTQQQQQQSSPLYHNRSATSTANTSMTSTMQEMMRAASHAVSQASGAIQKSASVSPAKDKTKILLIIDEPQTDWSRIFYGRKLFGDYDLKVEQAQFSEINLSACTSMGTTVEIRKSRPDHHTRAFQPDFVLIRQHVKNISNDYTNIVLGLRNGGVASVNSLDSIFNFLDKPWVFAHLIRIQRKIGKNKFPLISQSYYPNFKEMLVTPHFPVVVKMGHGHSGLGKVKVDHHYGFQDIASVAAMTNSYSTTELLIDSQCDIFVQKIGTNIRAFKRKCMSGNWKASMGAVILEPMPMNERYKSWVDECSKLFGGLDMMCIQIMQGKDGKEYIVEMNDSTMSILGSSQSEDYKLVVDLVISKMEQSSTFHNEMESAYPAQLNQNVAYKPYPQNQNLQQAKYGLQQSQGESFTKDEIVDDTMKNLKKTFAGIFGNM